MSNLPASLSPLMEPVLYDGKTYYTSQYFHQQYLANSPHKGKYRRHTHFLRALRSIESYQIYLDHSDIVELTWPLINTKGNPNEGSWKTFFQAAGWNPITLLNATAQAALSHHLDDELSKQVSVAINTKVGREETATLEGATDELSLIAQIAGAIQKVALELRTMRQVQQAQQQQLTQVEAKIDAALPLLTQAIESSFTLMTIEEFVLSNGLLSQFPGRIVNGVRVWHDEARRLRQYSEAMNYPMLPKRVDGKSWPTEKTYALQAFQWLCRNPTETHQSRLHIVPSTT